MTRKWIAHLYMHIPNGMREAVLKDMAENCELEKGLFIDGRGTDWQPLWKRKQSENSLTK